MSSPKANEQPNDKGGVLGRMSRKGLGTQSLAAKSQGLNKASIISIARQSVVTENASDGSELPWHSVPEAADVVNELASSVATGLSFREAARRLDEFGPNKLTPPARVTFLQRVWNQLNSAIIFVLFAAAIVEGAMQQWPEFGLVLIVVAINTAIGLIQEGKAESAAEKLKALLSPNARVLREGEQAIIPAEELVPGDIVLIKSGDKVPADLRLIEATNLQVQEAMLTGESVPSSKTLQAVPPTASLGDRKCMCYSATSVASGQGMGVVVGTGDSAEIGQINRLVNTVDRAQNNLVHQLHILGRWLALLVAIIALVAFLLALLHVDQGFEEAFKSAVSIAVAVIPEGLPAVVTIVLAIGTTVMARNNAIIRQLPAVETLGSVNSICSDKTGTLTKNEMTVVKVVTAASKFAVTGVGYAPTGFVAAEDEASSHSPPTSAPAANPALPHAPTVGSDVSSTAITIMPEAADVHANGEQQGGVGSSPAALTGPRLAALQALLQGLLLCNDSSLSQSVNEATGKDVYTPLGAPTEAALLVLGQKAGLDAKQLQGSCPRVAAVPFESEHKFMATVHEEQQQRGENGGSSGGVQKVMYVKGAPDRLLPMCSGQVQGDDLGAPPVPLDRAFWQQQQAQLSSQGLRVLALCRQEVGPAEDLSELSAGGLQKRTPSLSMVLMVAILDPPREEAIAAAKEAHQAGISVKMITGDHALTAQAIGRMLGITDTGGQVLTGPEIDAMNDGALQATVKGCNVYARASPENKLRIVRALQANKQVVAMTGDGVNDAPALKAADVGVAMGITGTDVSKEAAKMVLTDDNFASIVAAVREGRRVWDNIRKILIFNLPVNLAQGTSIMYAYILGLDNAPLTALQVLLVNLVTSVTLGLALAAEPPEPTVMLRPPRRPGKRLVGKLLLWRCVFVCHLIVVLVIGMFVWGDRQDYSLRQRRAEAFSVLVSSQVAYFVNCRFLKLSCLHPRVLRGNRWAYVAALLTLGVMVFLVCTPGVNNFFHMDIMEGLQWGRTFICMLVVFIVVEVEKALVDPLFMPVLRPVLRWLEDHTPEWLSVKQLNPVRQCRRPQADGKPVRRQQSRGRRAANAAATARGEVSENPAAKPASEMVVVVRN